MLSYSVTANFYNCSVAISKEKKSAQVSVAEGLCFREPAGAKGSSSRQTCPFLPGIPFEWHGDPEFTWHLLLGEKGCISHVEESGGESEQLSY